jgi:broad-specificity NMP kinase
MCHAGGSTPGTRRVPPSPPNAYVKSLRRSFLIYTYLRMNYLITGFPGTGKTSIAAELKKRGHAAYDTENMRGLMHTESRITGKHIHRPNKVPRDWYDLAGAYNWDPLKLSKLLQSSGDKFICAKAHNQPDFYDMFQHIFLLTLDFTELIQRLRSREGNAIGKTDQELSDILIHREHFEQSLLNHGATPINVARPLKEVVDSILASIP